MQSWAMQNRRGMAELAQQEKCGHGAANHEKDAHDVLVGRQPGLRGLKPGAENERWGGDRNRLSYSSSHRAFRGYG